MTWAEFQIRAFAFNRMQEREELLFREVSYSSYIGGSLMLKKLPSKNKFWQIGTNKSESSDRMNEAIKKAQDDYFKEKKKLENG